MPASPSPEPSSRRRRVPAMAPEDRRAALVSATVPLLRVHGVAVSTRQIADAAGVAEGTIFNVFPDKASLLRAALLDALDPQPFVEELAGIVPVQDLRVRLRMTVDLLRQRLTASEPVVQAARALGGDESAEVREFFDRLLQARRQIMAAVAAVFEPDRERLRRHPDTAARLLLMLVMANVHRGFGDPDALAEQGSDDIVSLLLDGLLVRPATTATGDPT